MTVGELVPVTCRADDLSGVCMPTAAGFYEPPVLPLCRVGLTAPLAGSVWSRIVPWGRFCGTAAHVMQQ
jgi:hypothetical protein